MAKLEWDEKLNVGIEAIDQQHRQIVDYINQLHDAYYGIQSPKKIGKAIDNLVDHALYHFNFEEHLQEVSGYPFLKAHQRAHDIFAKSLTDFQARFRHGEAISKEVDSLLATWFFDHLKHDDSDYVEHLREYLERHPEALPGKKGFISRLFG